MQIGQVKAGEFPSTSIFLAGIRQQMKKKERARVCVSQECCMKSRASYSFFFAHKRELLANPFMCNTEQNNNPQHNRPLTQKDVEI